MITAEDLDRIPVLAPLGRADKQWLAEAAAERVAAAGEVLFEQGQPAEHLYFVLEGRIAFRGSEGEGPPRFVVEAGDISGMLPRSRMTHWAGTGRATERVRAGFYHVSQFDEILARVPALDAILAAVLADRIRESTRMEQQRDRLMALGKLSAGLAHELNNPAAAIQRTVQGLRARIDDLPERAHALAGFGLDPVAFSFATHAEAARARKLSPVQRAEQEDDVADWLERQGVADAASQAETFVEAGLDVAALESHTAGLDRGARVALLEWAEASIAARLMLHEIASAAERVSGIVQSVKRYSHMDEAAVPEPTDVHEGLESTLTMLAHEIRRRNVQVVRDYDAALPRVPAVAGQLNQVWTNLIDNALDAMPEGGELRITTRMEDGAACVDVIDTGTGIPEDVQRRIFEPFFTTKAVGEGTGLGLDIARRIVTTVHGGEITLQSEPGRTHFTVRLPLRAAPSRSAPADAPAA